MDQRIRTSSEPGRGVTMWIDFRGVEDALNRVNSECIAFLQGPWVYEEVRSYANKIGRGDYDNIIIGSGGFTISEMIRGEYRGRSKTLDKVRGYLDRTVPTNPKPINDAIRECQFDRGDIIKEGVQDYVQSRRSKVGAEEEALEYFHFLESVPILDPIVMMAPHEALTFSQLIIYSRWVALNKDERPRLLVCSDKGGRWISAADPTVREPLTLDEVKRAIGDAINASPEQMESYLRIWTATHRRIRDTPYLPAFDADGFLRIAERLHEEAPAAQEVVEQIPVFVPAPVMFAEEANLIGLDRTAQQGADPMHVRGAARALKHQAQELAHAGIDNAIPRCAIALSRISHIFERLERTSPTEQADVIELGVEINSLGRRALEAQDHLSDYAARELIGFLAEANSFIRRFDTWRTYESAGPSTSADEKTAAAALVVLENALRHGLLTPEARQRVTESFVGSPDMEDPGSREGVARTTDSLTAAVSRRAMKSLRGAGTELEKEGTKRVVDFSLDFIAENSSNLIQFAATRAPWLGLVLRFLGQTGG